MKTSHFNARTKASFFALSFLILNACGGSDVTKPEEEKEKRVPVPKDVVGEFVRSLADGECSEAKKLTTGAATELVQATIDAGCMSYQTTIKSIDCTETGEDATCKCIEEREGGLGEMTYSYTLKRIDGLWKVSNYEKDFGDLESDTTSQASACESAGACDAACDGGSAEKE